MIYRPDDDPRGPRRSHAEPEIIPPGQDAEPRRRDRGSVWVNGHRVFVARPGPLALILGLLGLGALAAVGFFIFVGLVLLWLPILGILVAAGIIAALLRGPRRL